MQLGGEKEMIEQAQVGALQIARISLGPMGPLVPELNAFNLPFVFRDPEHMTKVVSGPIGDEMLKKLSDHPTAGLIGLCWMNGGTRNVYNSKHAVKTVADLKGLKIRTPSGDAWTLTFKAVGANPTPIDISELYPALQQGVVDGQENPYDNMLVRKFFQVQKFLSNTAHFYDWSGYMVNKAAFEKLTPDQQKAVRDAMFSAIAIQRAISERENKTALQGLIKGGMKYDALPPAEIAKFREATRSVYVEMRKRLGDKVMDLAEAAIKDCQ
jgi:tripartite ATP-independent transporter DctP family solute receptor